MTASSTPAPPPPDLLAAMQRMHASDDRGALELAEAALPHASDRTPYLALASHAALRLREPARAIPHLQALLEAKPDDRASRLNLATALVETGRMAEAIALIDGSGDPALARLDGYARQQIDDPEGAAAAYRRVLDALPNDLTSWNNLGNIHATAGRVDDAIDCYERAITLAPNDAGIYLNLAELLRKADRGRARLKVMRDAQAIAPDDRDVLTQLAMAHAHVEDRAGATASVPHGNATGLDTAISILEDVVRRFPDFGESHIELGQLYEGLNRVDDLHALVASIDRESAPPEAAFLFAWQAQRDGRFDEAAELAQGIPDTIHPMRRFRLIGSIADRRDDTATAFAAFERMNDAAVLDTPAARGPTFRATVERDTHLLTPEWRDSWQPVEIADCPRDPIFLVGFPRSGTTLLDTMLMGSPELSVLEERPMLARAATAAPTGELPALSTERVNDLRSRYFAAARAHGWDETRWLMDKQPLNMTHLPLICRLFPRARVILAERHPYDVVLSCFMANFQQNFAMRSFTSLEEAARTYDAVFSAWERARSLCQADVHAVRYERLVDDPRAELEPLVGWLGLAFDDRILAHEETAKARGRVRTASYSQIGERLYTRARDRWRRYAANLEPVLPILRPWADRMGYTAE